MNKLNQIKADFPILKEKVHGKDLVYLDNGATTQKPQVVIEAIKNYYQKNNSNIHRSVHELASRATIEYEKARSVVANFISAQTEEVIFTSGTTDGVNKLAQSLKSKFKPGDQILLSEMEHHSNIVPWQQLAKETGVQIKWLPINDKYRLDLTKLNSLISGKTKLCALAHVSNVLGTINPIGEIIQKIRKINSACLVVVDAAQSVPHLKVDVKELDCDFLVFSSHKTMGPTGVGVLFGKSSQLNNLAPNQTGGGMILEVTKKGTTFVDAPYRFEAGTPNVAGVVGLSAALNYLSNLGLSQIEKQMQELTEYGLSQLSGLSGLTILGPKNKSMRVPIFSFIVDGVHPHDVGEILNRDGIAVRGGNHCAMPLFEKLGYNGASRASLYIYNSKTEIDLLVTGIKKVQKIFDTVGGVYNANK